MSSRIVVYDRKLTPTDPDDVRVGDAVFYRAVDAFRTRVVRKVDRTRSGLSALVLEATTYVAGDVTHVLSPPETIRPKDVLRVLRDLEAANAPPPPPPKPVSEIVAPGPSRPDVEPPAKPRDTGPRKNLVEAFESSRTGWRADAAKGNWSTAAERITDFLDGRDPLDAELATLWFRLAQVLACDGKDAEALDAIQYAMSDGDAQWNALVKATAHFFQGDAMAVRGLRIEAGRHGQIVQRMIQELNGPTPHYLNVYKAVPALRDLAPRA